MSVIFFLDWRPVASAPISVAIDAGNLREEELIRLSQHAKDLGLGGWVNDVVNSVSFAIRSDGLFIFSVSLKRSLQEVDEINVSCVVSSFLKFEWGHEHVYDTENLLLSGDGGANVLQKYPVRVEAVSVGGIVSEKATESELATVLAECMQDVKKLLSFRASQWPSFRRQWGARSYSSRTHDERNALDVLRQKFDNIFIRVLVWQKEAKKPFENDFFIVRRRIWTFLLTFFVIVFGITVYETNPDFKNDLAISSALLCYGVTAAVAWIVAIYLVRRALEATRSYISLKLSALFGDVGSATRVWINRKLNSGLRRLSMHTKDAAFIALASGPFLFPIREVPAPTDLLKVLGIGIDWFGLERLSQIASVYSISSSEEFLSVFFQKGIFLMPFFLLVVYHWEINKLRLPVEKMLRNFIGYLNYAYVLDCILLRIRDSAGSFMSNSSGIERSIEIIKERHSKERGKRLAVQCLYSLAIVASSLAWLHFNADWLKGSIAAFGLSD